MSRGDKQAIEHRLTFENDEADHGASELEIQALFLGALDRLLRGRIGEFFHIICPPVGRLAARAHRRDVGSVAALFELASKPELHNCVHLAEDKSERRKRLKAGYRNAKRQIVVRHISSLNHRLVKRLNTGH